MELEVLDEEYVEYEIGEMAPSKGTIYRNQDPSKIPYTFDKIFYSSNSYYPKETINVSDPYIVRNVRGVNVEFRPFQYNPDKGSIKITKN